LDRYQARKRRRRRRRRRRRMLIIFEKLRGLPLCSLIRSHAKTINHDG
jgi:hypothetical protein